MSPAPAGMLRRSLPLVVNPIRRTRKLQSEGLAIFSLLDMKACATTSTTGVTSIAGAEEEPAGRWRSQVWRRNIRK